MSYAQQGSSSSSGSGLGERGGNVHEQQQQPTSSYDAGTASTAEAGPSAAPPPSSVSKVSQSKNTHKTGSMTKRQQAAHRARILAVSLIFPFGKSRWGVWCCQAHIWPFCSSFSFRNSLRLVCSMGCSRSNTDGYVSIHVCCCTCGFCLLTSLQTCLIHYQQSNQTHSEVENLYYRHERSISSGPSPAPTRKLSATGVPSSSSNAPAAVGTANAPASTSSHSNHQPKTPLAFHRPSFSAGGGGAMGAATGAANLAKKPPVEPVAADVFGGLMTPPASNGAVPTAQRHAEYRNANKLSPVEGGGNALNAASGRANASSTYDDFWSKIGASTNTGATSRPSVGGRTG